MIVAALTVAHDEAATGLGGMRAANPLHPYEVTKMDRCYKLILTDEQGTILEQWRVGAELPEDHADESDGCSLYDVSTKFERGELVADIERNIKTANRARA